MSTFCGVAVQAGYQSGQTFYPYSGETVHFTHMTNRVAAGTVSAAMVSVGTTYQFYVGQTAPCGTNQAHSQQSADIGPTTPYWRYLPLGSAETCWSNVSDTVQSIDTTSKIIHGWLAQTMRGTVTMPDQAVA